MKSTHVEHSVCPSTSCGYDLPSSPLPAPFDDAAERKRRRDRRVKAVENVLQKHKISYHDSLVPHVVVVNQPGFPDVYLSLKSRSDDKGHVQYMYRFAGTDEWHTTRRDYFVGWLTQPFQPTEIMPFGKHRGQSLEWIASQERRYLAWLYEAPRVDAHLRYSIAILLGKFNPELDEDEFAFLPPLASAKERP